VELKEPFALWWWRQNEFVYPHVAPVAKGVHGSPGSEIENVSISGLIIGLRRHSACPMRFWI
jgi:hypothetical protein